MEPRTHCQKCGTEILVVTARYHHGRCAPCWSRRPSKRILAKLETIPLEILRLLAMPFLIAWEYAVIVRRRRRFPYPLGPLRKQVHAVYQNRRATRLYLHELIKGYFEPGVFMLPANPRNLAGWVGHRDGSALKEGRLAISDLPSSPGLTDRTLVSPHKERKL